MASDEPSQAGELVPSNPPSDPSSAHPSPSLISTPPTSQQQRLPSQAPQFTLNDQTTANDLETLASVKAARPAASNSSLWTGMTREATVVRGRQGSVLTRGLVLKTDHFQGTSGEWEVDRIDFEITSTAPDTMLIVSSS